MGNQKLETVEITQDEAMAIVSILKNLKDLMAISKTSEKSGALKDHEKLIYNFLTRNNIDSWSVFQPINLKIGSFYHALDMLRFFKTPETKALALDNINRLAQDCGINNYFISYNDNNLSYYNFSNPETPKQISLDKYLSLLAQKYNFLNTPQ